MKTFDYQSLPAGAFPGRRGAQDSITPPSSPDRVRVVGNIWLREGWASNNPDRVFNNQTFEISQKSKTARIGLDGRIYVTRSPKNITWYGGTLTDLEHIVLVKIVSLGAILVNDGLCTGNGLPREVPGGVTFEVPDI